MRRCRGGGGGDGGREGGEGEGGGRLVGGRLERHGGPFVVDVVRDLQPRHLLHLLLTQADDLLVLPVEHLAADGRVPVQELQLVRQTLPRLRPGPGGQVGRRKDDQVSRRTCEQVIR